jgi:hypothetical protein
MRGIDASVIGLTARTENVGDKLYMENSPPELYDGYVLQ